jgi:hypothetical protein
MKMRRPSFLHGVMLAALLSFFGAAVFAAAGTLLAGGLLLRAVIAGLSLCYLLYLLSRSREATGRVTTVALWLALATLLWFFEPPLVLFVIAHAMLIWLVRSLYFHASLLGAGADLGLCGLGLAAAVWATTQSHSLGLALWCFFLVQALFVLIPARLTREGSCQQADDGEARFERAYRSAESALRRMHAS